MSISDQITRIRTNIENAYAICSNKGATLPSEENSDNLAVTIDTITVGGGGDTVSAINKTGAAISQGDKVWINPEGVNVGNNYKWTVNNTSAYPVYGDEWLLVGGSISKFAALGALTDIEITGVNAPYARKLTYLESGETIMVNYNGANILKADSLFTNFGKANNVFQSGYTSTFNVREPTVIKKINVNSLEISNTWTLNNNVSINTVIDNVAYGYDHGYNQYKTYTLADDNTFVSESFNHGISFGTNLSAIGITSDRAYAIVASNNLQDEGSLTFYSMAYNGNKYTFTVVADSELPAEIVSIKSACRAVFNVKNNILTLSRGAIYLVYKYTNGQFVKQNIDLGISSLIPENGSIYCPLFSRDMSRAVVRIKNTSGTYDSYTCLLQNTFANYSLVAYKPYLIAQSTLTGKASESINSAAIGSVATVVASGVNYV